MYIGQISDQKNILCGYSTCLKCDKGFNRPKMTYYQLKNGFTRPKYFDDQIDQILFFIKSKFARKTDQK